MRPDFLRFVQAHPDGVASFPPVPLLADPGLDRNFRVFHSWDDFHHHLRARINAGANLLFEKNDRNDEIEHPARPEPLPHCRPVRN